jgi:redox-sensitive bicupin YhaK (pirin superfamily)
VHELAPRRSAWLHLVRGQVTLADIVLTTGDGAGVTAERAVSITASEESEILLVDVGGQLPRPSYEGWAPRQGPSNRHAAEGVVA